MSEIEKLNDQLRKLTSRIFVKSQDYIWHVGNLSTDYSSLMILNEIINTSKKLENIYLKVKKDYYTEEGDIDEKDL